MGRYEDVESTLKTTIPQDMSIDQVALVALDIPYKHSFYYSIPHKFYNKLKKGHLVRVPLRTREKIGIVLEVSELEKDTEQGINLKEVISLPYEEPIISPLLMEFAKWISNYYLCSLGMILKAFIPEGMIPKKNSTATKSILSFEDERVSCMREKPSIRSYTYEAITLSSEQHHALEQINKTIDNQCFVTFLLHGITGSGKTEIYLRAIQHAVDSGRQAILLAPEIAITHQLIQRFTCFFDDCIAVIHSRLNRGERRRAWLRIRKGQAKVVIGARSALFAPVPDLGLIIVDEEHDSSYKQDMSPRYNGRDIAIVRAKLSSCPAVLGSATPSLESYYNVLQGKYTLLSLTTRPTPYALPPVTILDLKNKKNEVTKEESVISPPLKNAIEEVLKRKKQVLIFQNRRGYSPYLLCPKCGYVPKCAHCNVSLTYHRSDNRLKCHYCEFQKPLPKECRFCKGVSYQYWGHGTQKIEEHLIKLFPEARIARMDRDSMSRKGMHAQILDQVKNQEIDILIGTQIITKGLHLPDIILVGVVGSDNILNLPDFRAAEKTFQMIMQVSGRCGRGDQPGHVLLQTFTPQHYSIKYAAQHNYIDFYKREIQFRKHLLYPPFSRILNIIVKGKERKLIAHAATDIKRVLITHRSQNLRILGPSQAPLSKLRNLYRYQFIIKAKDHTVLKSIGEEVTSYIAGHREYKRIQVDLDVDPVNLL
ncbi:MAG: primosomal protein N' [bacterium]